MPDRIVKTVDLTAAELSEIEDWYRSATELSEIEDWYRSATGELADWDSALAKKLKLQPDNGLEKHWNSPEEN